MCRWLISHYFPCGKYNQHAIAICAPNQVFLQLPHSRPATLSIGSVQNFAQLPPLLHVPIQPSIPIVPRSAPFKLFLLCRNITTCHGCQNKFLHTGAPNDLERGRSKDCSYRWLLWEHEEIYPAWAHARLQKNPKNTVLNLAPRNCS